MAADSHRKAVAPQMCKYMSGGVCEVGGCVGDGYTGSLTPIGGLVEGGQWA